MRTDPRIRFHQPPDDEQGSPEVNVREVILERENAALRVENQRLRSVVRSIVQTATPYAVGHNKR
jgi:hypothetical protein